MLILGAMVLVQAFARFAAEGHGTPAPAERLVIGGRYRHVRNPMYLAVVAAITVQALALGRPVLLGYAAAVWVTVASFVRWYEERPWPASPAPSTRHTGAPFQPGDHEPGHASRARQTAMAPATHLVRQHRPGVPLADSGPQWCSWLSEPSPTEQFHLSTE